MMAAMKILARLPSAPDLRRLLEVGSAKPAHLAPGRK
jgi:hypothetical protein